MPRIILASQSPRRKQLLEWAEISFEIIVEPTDEAILPHLSPAEAAIHIASQKAKAVRERCPGDIIIAADTIVVLGEEIIGKPQNRNHAIEILTKLAGNTHQVITGVEISRGEKTLRFADTTEVEFHPLSNHQICFYVDQYRPYDKAGAYAIQEWIGVTGIKRIAGDFYNVMGLPVSRVVQALKDFTT